MSCCADIIVVSLHASDESVRECNWPRAEVWWDLFEHVRSDKLVHGRKTLACKKYILIYYWLSSNRCRWYHVSMDNTVWYDNLPRVDMMAFWKGRIGGETRKRCPSYRGLATNGDRLQCGDEGRIWRSSPHIYHLLRPSWKRWKQVCGREVGPSVRESHVLWQILQIRSRSYRP